MKVISFFTAVSLAFSLSSQPTSADQLCHDNGALPPSGCMNISWACGTFSVGSGQVCVSSIMVPSADIKRELGQNGDINEIGTSVAKSNRREIVAPPKSVSCPPLCQERPEPPIIVE